MSPARTRYACLLAVVLLLIPLQRLRIGGDRSFDTRRLMITTNHPGLEASAVERLITIPLENAVSGVTGLRSIRSLSASGRSTIELDYLDGIDPIAAYLEVRQWLDAVHSLLPPASHHPLLTRGSMEGRPVFTVAFPADGWTERDIRRRFERIDGVARVEISGLPRPDVLITPDRGRDAMQFTNASVEALRAAHSVASIRRRTQTPVVIDGRLRSPAEMEALRLASGLNVGNHVRVRIGPSPLRSWATVRGKPLALVAVHREGDGSLIALSRRLRAGVDGIEDALILIDRGDALARAVRGVLWAIAAGIVAATAVVAAIRRSVTETLYCAASIAVAGVSGLSAAALAGVELTAESLAAVAVSAGLVVDLALFFLEARGPTRSAARARREIAPTIVCATATTLVVFVPLLWWAETAHAGLTALAVVIAGSLIGGLLFVLGAAGAIPDDMPVSPPHGGTRATPRHRYLLLLPGWALRRRHRVVAASVAISLAGSVATWNLIRFSEPRSPESSVSMAVEFSGGTTAESVHSAVAPMLDTLDTIAGVETTIALIEAERARIELLLDRGVEATRVQDLARSLSRNVPHATVWFPQDGSVDPRRSVSILVRATTTGEAQRIAHGIAARLGDHPLVDDVLLRFKRGADACIVQTDLVGLARTGITLRDVVEPIRRVHSRPVVAKWHQQGRELDVVLATEQPPPGECAPDARWLTAVVPPGAGGSLSASWDATVGRIPRHDRAPSAELLVVTTRPSEIRSVVTREFTKLPSFATVHVDPFAPERRRHRRAARSASGVALILVGLVLVMRYQQLRAGFIALALVPPTLAVPLVFASILRAPVDLALLAGLLLCAGTGVNNTILVLDRMQAHGERGLEAIRRSLAPIAPATLTTVTAVIPLVWLPAAAGSAATISLLVAVGAVTSCAATALLLPAVLAVSQLD